ncbi:MAG: replicative DNA helicase [Patescibacteria group bacterium]
MAVPSPFFQLKDSVRVPPQNLDAEKALLGSIMLRPDAIHEILDTVTPHVFYSEQHRIIFEVMLELFSKNTPIDLLSLSSRLKEKNLLDGVGGASYLADLTAIVPSSSHIEHYGAMVRKKYMMRKLIEASEHISLLGYDEVKELDEVLDLAEKRIFEITHSSNIHRFIELKEALGEAWERLDALHRSKEKIRGVPTGFAELDNKLSGLQQSDLIILAARPSMGKTSLALDIARQAAVGHNIPVGIFSLEMSSQQLVDRILAAQSRVDAWKLRTGQLSVESDFDKIRDSLDVLSKAPIYIDDQAGTNILKIRSVARRLKSEKNLGLIIVDYLQLMAPTNTRASDSLVQQVTEISRSLKHLARELKIPVLALSQLSRAVEQRGGRPRLSDLRDSGSIEQDADVVMFIHREDKYNENSERPNVAEILIEKHRNGPTGKVELYFDDKKSTFLTIEKSGHGGSEKEFQQF